jgi:hypothetical protein
MVEKKSFVAIIIGEFFTGKTGGLQTQTVVLGPSSPVSGSC